jgi:hypothetical protein
MSSDITGHSHQSNQEPDMRPLAMHGKRLKVSPIYSKGIEPLAPRSGSHEHCTTPWAIFLIIRLAADSPNLTKTNALSHHRISDIAGRSPEPAIPWPLRKNFPSNESVLAAATLQSLFKKRSQPARTPGSNAFTPQACLSTTLRLPTPAAAILRSRTTATCPPT